MTDTTELRNCGVARIWRGRTLPEKAEEYSRYLYENGVRKLEALGALQVQMFREDRGSDSYFMIISFWNDLDAMTQWAGTDPTKIRHLERDADMLIELPRSVQILDVVSSPA